MMHLRRAGFEVRRSKYANTLLFPVVAVRGLLKHFGIGTGTDAKPLPAGLGWLDPVFRGLLYGCRLDPPRSASRNKMGTKLVGVRRTTALLSQEGSKIETQSRSCEGWFL